MRFSLFIIFSIMLSCAGCSTVDVSNWAVIEIRKSEGIKLHEPTSTYYIAGGDPARADLSWGRHPVNWTLCAEPVASSPATSTNNWPHVRSGHVSKQGFLAMARGKFHGTRYAGRTEVCQLVDGEVLAKMENDALAVAWSNDGTRLAILRIGRQEKNKRVTFLTLWEMGSGDNANWELSFDPFAERWSSCADNYFALSWNRADSHIAVSVRGVPINGMAPQCVIVDTEDGPLCTYEASDAYFLGEKKLIANEHGEWDGVCILELKGDHLERVDRLGRKMFLAGSDPMSGKYIAWHTPPLWPPKAFSLPLGFHDSSGDLPIESTGFQINSSLQLVPMGRLANMLARDHSLAKLVPGDRNYQNRDALNMKDTIPVSESLSAFARMRRQ